MDLQADTLIRLVVATLYLGVGFVAFRWLMPRLTPAGKGAASLFLAAQAFAIAVALYSQPASSFEEWIWHLNREWNIPATIASLQLAMVGGVAILAAALGRSYPAWARVYQVALGLVFFVLAADEYFVVHEFVVGWLNFYFVFGAAIALATALVALRLPRSAGLWQATLLAGLAMTAAGGLVIESSCGGAVFAAFGSCAKHFLLEEPLEFLGVWLALIAVLGMLPRGAGRLRHRQTGALFAIPALWLLALALGSGQIHSISRYGSDSRLADVEFQSGARLLGYILGKDKDSIHLFLSPGRWDYRGRNFAGLGYSIHLVDQASGESVLSRDSNAHSHHFLIGPRYAPVYRQWLHIDRPATLTANRAYWIVLTLWREAPDSAFQRQRVLASDHRLLSDTQVILSELVVPADSPAESASPAPLASFDNGFALETAHLPERARAGENLTIEFVWRSDADGSEDHAQFLHLGHAESGEWWVHDWLPLGARLPTRLWYRGLVDSETWQAPLPADLAPGVYNVFSGLYRSRDRERVPAKSAEGGYFLDARVPLGRLVIE